MSNLSPATAETIAAMWKIVQEVAATDVRYPYPPEPENDMMCPYCGDKWVHSDTCITQLTQKLVEEAKSYA